MYLKYYKAILISQEQESYLKVTNSLEFSSKSPFNGLNTNYLTTCKIIENLQFQISPDKLSSVPYEWENNLCSLIVEGRDTTLLDNVWDTPDIAIDTQILLNALIERKVFMESFTSQGLLNEINIAFNQLKQNPEYYLVNRFNGHFRIISNRQDFVIDLYNFREGFSKNTEDLIQPIKINESYFNFPN